MTNCAAGAPTFEYLASAIPGNSFLRKRNFIRNKNEPPIFILIFRDIATGNSVPRNQAPFPLNPSKKSRMSKLFYPFCTVLVLFLACPNLLWGQETDSDAFFIRSIYDQALTKGQSYGWLRRLTKEVGPRLSGSPQAEAGVILTKRILEELDFDTVFLQPCEVPRWERGAPEQVRIVGSQTMGSVDLRALALGNSIGTGPDGITAEVIEVFSLDTLELLGEAALAGKIVFFNRPLDPTQLNTFAAYGGAVDQRGLGAARAAPYGAVGVIVRSMTTRTDTIPHTGTLRYSDGVDPIPAVAISTVDADLLSRLLRQEPVRVYMQTNCRMLPPVTSYNVVAERRGTTRPDEIILVGGHLDSWDVGEGAHDDGAGCVQAMQVWPILQALSYEPQRTLRCVLFMNEENGLVGGRAYWDASSREGLQHYAAIESDRGGFTPRGFSCDALESVFTDYYRRVNSWLPLLEPYGLTFSAGGSGADISGLKSEGGMLFGFVPDSQRYFDFHHTATDTFEAVNRRELELGAAAITALVYLLDSQGLKPVDK